MNTKQHTTRQLGVRNKVLDNMVARCSQNDLLVNLDVDTTLDSYQYNDVTSAEAKKMLNVVMKKLNDAVLTVSSIRQQITRFPKYNQPK